MFGLRLTTKTEVDIWKATISDLRREVAELKAELVRERRRSEGAINILLAKQTGMVLDPEGQTSQDEVEKLQSALFDLWGDQSHEQEEQRRLMEDIQS